jgi:hypothetical protein
MVVKILAKHTWYGAPIAGVSAIKPSDEPQEVPDELALHLVAVHPYWFTICDCPVTSEVAEIAPQPVDRMARTSRRRK